MLLLFSKLSVCDCVKSREPKRSESGFSPSLSSKRELTEDSGAVRAVSGPGVVIVVGSGGIIPSVFIPSPTALRSGCGMVFGGVGACCVCFTACIPGVVGGLGIAERGCVGRMGSVGCEIPRKADCSSAVKAVASILFCGSSKVAVITGSSLTTGGSGILIGFSRAIRCAFFSL